MTNDINNRIYQQFQVRLEGESAVSPQTIQVLLDDQQKSNFGEDDILLKTIAGLDE